MEQVPYFRQRVFQVCKSWQDARTRWELLSRAGARLLGEVFNAGLAQATGTMTAAEAFDDRARFYPELEKVVAGLVSKA